MFLLVTVPQSQTIKYYLMFVFNFNPRLCSLKCRVDRPFIITLLALKRHSGEQHCYDIICRHCVCDKSVAEVRAEKDDDDQMIVISDDDMGEDMT